MDADAETGVMGSFGRETTYAEFADSYMKFVARLPELTVEQANGAYRALTIAYLSMNTENFDPMQKINAPFLLESAGVKLVRHEVGY